MDNYSPQSQNYSQQMINEVISRRYNLKIDKFQYYVIIKGKINGIWLNEEEVHESKAYKVYMMKKEQRKKQRQNKQNSQSIQDKLNQLNIATPQKHTALNKKSFDQNSQDGDESTVLQEKPNQNSQNNHYINNALGQEEEIKEQQQQKNTKEIQNNKENQKEDNGIEFEYSQDSIQIEITDGEISDDEQDKNNKNIQQQENSVLQNKNDFNFYFEEKRLSYAGYLNKKRKKNEDPISENPNYQKTNGNPDLTFLKQYSYSSTHIKEFLNDNNKYLKMINMGSYQEDLNILKNKSHHQITEEQKNRYIVDHLPDLLKGVKLNKMQRKLKEKIKSTIFISENNDTTDKDEKYLIEQDHIIINTEDKLYENENLNAQNIAYSENLKNINTIQQEEDQQNKQNNQNATINQKETQNLKIEDDQNSQKSFQNQGCKECRNHYEEEEEKEQKKTKKCRKQLKQNSQLENKRMTRHQQNLYNLQKLKENMFQNEQNDDSESLF